MAKSLSSLTIRAMKVADRERVRQAKAAARGDILKYKEQVRQAKAYEAKIRRALIEDGRNRKAYEIALIAAHTASQLAEVDSLNAQIEDEFKDLAGLLDTTIHMDDYVDLEALRRSEDTTPFDRPELEIPVRRPLQPKLPAKPKYIEPAKPSGLFGMKRKLAEAQERARQTHEDATAEWTKNVAALQSNYEHSISAYKQAEARRVQYLEREKTRFREELKRQNLYIDKFISDLSYGDATAVQEYISLVVENPIYPDHFPISYDFSFDTLTAELMMKVAIPAPGNFPSIKAYKYVKESDEIREIALSRIELKHRYSSVLYQVAIRSLHEVFEADRRGLIKTIALEVGTKANDHATGKPRFLSFVGVSAEKDSFVAFNLSGLVPLATLKHLGAAISKDPISLIAADVAGVRKA